MGLLEKGSKGIRRIAPIIGIYGDGGLGKTTFASEAPSPYVLDVNGGSDNLNVHRSERIKTFDQALSVMRALIDETHAFKTLVIDGLDDLETMVQAKVCADNKPSAVDSIVKAAGGYGNGYRVMLEQFLKLQSLIVELREKKGLQVIFTLHAIVTRFNDPTTPEGYDRFVMKLVENNQASIRRAWFDFADVILFAKRKVLAVSGDMKRAMDASPDGMHVIYTSSRATFDAKNRYDLPHEIPLHWENFQAAMNAGPKKLEQIKSEIEALAKEVSNQRTVEAIKENVKKVGDNVNDLIAIAERIKEILATQAPVAA
jgi:hypothetical protein